MQYNTVENSGMYIILNKINNNVYVGITEDFKRRWTIHKRNLIMGFNNKNCDNFLNNNPNCRHHQLYLQIEFNEFYSLYNNKIWDIVYEFKPFIKVNYDNYSKKIFEALEDAYILQYRKIQNGYYQMTNEEHTNCYKWVEVNNKIEIINFFALNRYNIEKMYITDKMNCVEIAKILNTEATYVHKYLNKWGIQTRNYSEAILKFNIEEKKETIINLYQVQNISATNIAKLFNTTCTTICKYLTKWGVNCRKQSEIQLGFNIEKHKEEIIDCYINKKMSTIDIGKLFHVSKKCINTHLKEWNITLRTGGETIKYSQTGDKRYNSIYVIVKNNLDDKTIVFGSVSECGRWIVELGLKDTQTSARSAINKCIKRNKQLGNYTFSKFTKSQYLNMLES